MQEIFNIRKDLQKNNIENISIEWEENLNLKVICSIILRKLIYKKTLSAFEYYETNENKRKICCQSLQY